VAHKVLSVFLPSGGTARAMGYSLIVSDPCFKNCLHHGTFQQKQFFIRSRRVDLSAGELVEMEGGVFRGSQQDCTANADKVLGSGGPCS